MMELCHQSYLVSESDVEQKFIMPLLIAPPPNGFGFSVSEIHTKETICSQVIGKGTSSKNYVPDYLITIKNIPLLVIEAKRPNSSDNLYQAYSEA